MKKQIKIVCIFLYCCGCLNSWAQPAANNTYALVAGISGYRDAAIPRLSYADKDAVLFSQWLQTNAGGSVPQYNIKLLTNEKATVAAFYDGLDWLKNNAKENDLVYIYFSGHGDVETQTTGSRGYLLSWNSPPNNYLNNAISVTDLNNTANEITTKNKAKIILITDACHSGKMAGDFYKGRQFTAANLRLVLNNQVRMASCRENEEAAEGIGWGGGRGIFSYYLLQGLAGAAEKNTVVKLENLQHFLDSCFAADTELKLSKHIQHPISDGSPVFKLAQIDSTIKTQLKKTGTLEKTAAFTSGLQSLRSVGPQPADYFFAKVAQPGFESTLPFRAFENDPSDLIIIKMIDSLVEKEKMPIAVLDKDFENNSAELENNLAATVTSIKVNRSLSDSEKSALLTFRKDYINRLLEGYKKENIQAHDTLNHLLILQQQLHENAFSRKRFAERFVQLVHYKSQDMINAYLKGDLAELEKRQYYATGNRNYREFLPLIKLAVKLAPENNYLKNILEINEAYLAGLIDRLDITTHASAADSLLFAAAVKIQRAMSMEPYSAYIHNEMGNIYFQKKMYDSALYHFNYATLLSPAWAIPFSNKIRVNLAENRLPQAVSAAHTADSLQSNLAFVNTNAGLVMEKTGNLLAAESYYRRAIKENNVHYLPYERLGNLYIRTGDYVKADLFLYEATVRKELFAVNDAVFTFGIEQGGGLTEMSNGEGYVNICTDKIDSLFTGKEKYKELLHAISNLLSGKDSLREKGKKSAKEVLRKWPDIILAAHYWGKVLYLEKNYREAEIVLKKAVLNYKTAEELKKQLLNTFTDSLPGYLLLQKKIIENIDSSCLLKTLLYLQYDGLEDHYLLAKMYEKNGNTEEALQEYKIISGIENRKQNDQAAVKGYYQPVKNWEENEKKFQKYLYENDLDEDKFIYKYNNPVTMGGSLKTARILEKKERYIEAEHALLAQIAQNQAAGFVRQKKMNESIFMPTDHDSLNVYWLHINEDLEMETFHFYDRMIGMFPRDGYWYKNAGLFLYKRLWMTYRQIKPAEREAFYRYSTEYSYPFKSGVEAPLQYMPVDKGGLGLKTKRLFLPGTGEEIILDTTGYDPLIKANYFLQQAIKFSGDKLPNPALTENVADLQAWMGRYDSAIINYDHCVHAAPQNLPLRKKLIQVLRLNEQLPRLAKELEFLQKNNKLDPTQKSELARYFILQKKYTAAANLIQSAPETNSKEAISKILLYIKLYMLKGNFPKALAGVNSGIANVDIDRENWEAITYTQARIEALTNKKTAALSTLRYLLVNGVKLFYVLNNDNVWNAFRNTENWKLLMQQYFTGKNYYEDRGISENTDTVKKRIPALQ